MFRSWTIVLAAIALSACGGAQETTADASALGAGDDGAVDVGSDGGDSASTDMAGGGGGGLTPNQKAVAEAMTSIWENDTPILDYAYSENINDGAATRRGAPGFAPAPATPFRSSTATTSCARGER